jgi:L-alanine-DL-glutamate epimerase-like enolase superfamily enzyme
MSTLHTSVAIAQVRALLFRARAERPLVTSFGSLLERPALVVEITDQDGARGWGEVWCNFPPYAAENRARFLKNVVAPALEGLTFDEPADAGRRTDKLFGIQAIQAGEEGLLASVIAGLDQALWDLVARRHDVPLWQALGGLRNVRVYASGIDPEHALSTVIAEQMAGHRAFKLKIGFSDRIDIEIVAAVREQSQDEIMLMVDANQAWSPRQALEVAVRLTPFKLEWLEEPIRADEPFRVWRELATRSPIALAAGENIRSTYHFTRMIENRLVAHIQPDVGKWGGVSHCLAVGRRAVDAGIGYSPHWHGGGIGLAISLNLLGAVGGSGLGEIDVNPNPLRDAFPLPPVNNGMIELSDQPGFGFEPDMSGLRHFRRDID